MSEKKKGNGFFKKLLKGIGGFFLIILIVAVIGVAGAWLNGSLFPEKVYIQKLSINGVKEYVAITENDSSFTTTISYEPAEANQLTLTPKILTGGDLIEPLTNIVAGQPLTLQFKKHDNGVTKGGEVEIKFVDSAQQSFATLKVLIDVGLDTQHLEVSSNGDSDLDVDADTNIISTNVLTTVSKENANTIKISANYDEMLNSYKGNWSESENNSVVNLHKLKKMILRYDDDVRVNTFEVSEVMGDENYYLIKYLTPATTDMTPFVLKVYLYKTYFLEKVFEEKLANDLFSALDETNFEKASFDYDKVNDFINTYVYEASDVETKNNFNIFRDATTGLIKLAPAKYAKNSTQFIQALNDTLDYVFASKTIHISVKNIQVSNIVNQNLSTEIPFSVLKTYTYSIDDVNEELGISLQGAEANTDQQVLFNALRGLDIVLCHESSQEEYETALASETYPDGMTALDYKISVIRNYYQIGTTYLKKVDVNSSETKFTIEKNVLDDGDVSWTIKSLSPTYSSDKYYLLYLYSKNDFEKDNEITMIPTGGTKDYYYKYNENIDAWFLKTSSFDGKLPSGVNNLATNLIDVAKCYNWKLACSPIKISFTSATIRYNKSDDINNNASTTIALNTENTIYKNVSYNGKLTSVAVKHGDDGGVYYGGREFSIGTMTSAESVLNTNVIIQPADYEALDYSHVKWFVKYSDNIITDEDSVQRYYFKPVVDVAYDDSATSSENKENAVPVKYRLKHIIDNTFIGSETDFFMEVGNNNFKLEALNAMDENKPITLYAAIIQTDINGNPMHFDESSADGVKQITLHYIDYTRDNDGHTIYATKYIERLNMYIGAGDDSLVCTNSTTTTGSEITHNFLFVEYSKSISGYLYLTSFNLTEGKDAGEPILSSGDWVEGSKVIMQNAIDVERNEKIALTKFYTEFLQYQTSSGGIWDYEEYEQSTSYPTITAPTIEIQTDSNLNDGGKILGKPYIVFSITNIDPALTGAWSYTFIVDSSNHNAENILYTSVSTIGYFKLCEEGYISGVNGS